MQEAMFQVKARARGDGPYLPGADDSDLHMSSIRALQKKDRFNVTNPSTGIRAPP